MENELHSDERFRRTREQAAAELAEIREKDESSLTPRMLVRKAMLLQFEETSNGTPEEIETTLRMALDRDDRYIEAYIELGRYYYAIADDAEKAKPLLLKALGLLRDLYKEILPGLVDCDVELTPNRDPHEIQKEYEAMFLASPDDSTTQ